MVANNQLPPPPHRSDTSDNPNSTGGQSMYYSTIFETGNCRFFPAPLSPQQGAVGTSGLLLVKWGSAEGFNTTAAHSKLIQRFVDIIGWPAAVLKSWKWATGRIPNDTERHVESCDNFICRIWALWQLLFTDQHH